MSFLQFMTYYIVGMYTTIILLKCYKCLSNSNNTNNSKIFIIIFSLLMILNNLFNIIALRFICSTILTFLAYKFYFKDSLKKTFYYTFFIIIFSSIFELLFSIVLFNFSDIAKLNNNILIKGFFTIIDITIVYFILKQHNVKKIVNGIKESIENHINLSGIIIIITMLFNIFFCIRGYNLKNIYFIIFTFVNLNFIILVCNIIIKEKNSIIMLQCRNNNLKDSYKAYAETIEEWRELKHNLKNDLYGLKTTLSKDKQEILNQIITKYNKNCEWINSIDNIPEGLQGIIYLKKNEAEQQKIKVLLNSNKYIKTKVTDYFDLCDIIGILIDNAIEATKNIKNKVFEINISENNNEVSIKIINKFNNVIDLNKIGKKNYSTKLRKSGLGLNYINKIRKTNIKVKYEVINDLFITTIIYKQKIN